MLRLRLSSFALSVTQYIAPVPQLSASGSAKRLVLAPIMTQRCARSTGGVFFGRESAFIEAADQPGYVPQGAGESG